MWCPILSVGAPISSQMFGISSWGSVGAEPWKLEMQIPQSETLCANRNTLARSVPQVTLGTYESDL